MDAPLVAQATQIDTGDTAWMLAATALVLMMTLALGLFYAGLVRAKNALNTFMMCVSAIAIAGVMWALIGYSLAFDGTGDLIGGLNYVGLHDVTFAPRDGTTIPHLVFFAFQATFCIITVALISGAVVERMRFGALDGVRRPLVGAGLLGARPLGLRRRLAAGGRDARLRGRHRGRDGLGLLGPGGRARRRGAQGLRPASALLPHNSVLVLLGGGLLWFGWFGFNGGSGFGTGDPSVLAFTNTLLCPGGDAVHLDDARPDPRPEGDGGRAPRRRSSSAAS